MKKHINICVAYARKDKQWIIPITVPLGTTIDLAIKQSGILEECAERSRENLHVGIFGMVKRLSDVLKDGDRVEIYRPLSADPKELRRGRAHQ